MLYNVHTDSWEGIRVSEGICLIIVEVHLAADTAFPFS